MSYEPGMGTLVGLALGTVANNNEVRQADIRAIRKTVTATEESALWGQANARATALVIDEVLAEVAKMQRGELGNAQRTVSLSNPTGRKLRNEAFVKHVSLLIKEVSEGSLQLGPDARQRILTDLPLD